LPALSFLGRATQKGGPLGRLFTCAIAFLYAAWLGFDANQRRWLLQGLPVNPTVNRKKRQKNEISRQSST
jgi:hypothetical protein